MPRPVAPPSPLMEAVRRIEAEQAKAERRAKKKATEPEPAPAPKKTRAARNAEQL